MLNMFMLANGRLIQQDFDPAQPPGTQPVWVDLEAPEPQEKAWVAAHFGLTIPADVDDDDLEESERINEEDNGELHIRSA